MAAEEILEREFPPFTFPIERGKIREWALALRETNPVYFDPEAARAQGFRDVPAPPTFLRQFWWETPESDPMEHLGFSVERRLLGEQEFEYLAPVVAGEVLTGRSRVVSLVEKEGRRGGKMKIAVIETRFTNQRGELVQVGRRTLIETAAPPKGS
ncbi:MAG: MaoC family dehydratase N-terminal domain-containing protein [Nitrospinota bacterium]